MSLPFGFLNIDKPLGITSHDVVHKVRRAIKFKKIGHAGTLDPLATGVLVLCIGSATRLSEYAMASTKQYQARIRLGATTATYDAEGEIENEQDTSHLTREQVEQALPAFLGAITQLPPMYSAVKQGGRKLYEIARAGETVERQPRHVTIHALEITDWSLPEFTLNVTCSAGTYIRSLAHDLGAALGVGGYLAGLVRTRSGAFSLENAVPLDTLIAAENWQHYLIPPQTALADWRIITPDAEGLNYLAHGRTLNGADAEDGALAFAFTPDGDLLAVVKAQSGLWRPEKVFLP